MKDFGLLLARSGILVKITDSCSYKIVPMKKINLIVFIYSLIGNIFYSGSARSSRLQMFYFYKKGVLQIFVRLLFYKVAGLRPATLVKMRLRHKCFPVNVVKF